MPFGSPVPAVEFSGSTALAQKKNNRVDFNSGTLAGDVSREGPAAWLCGKWFEL